ncbi:MAG: response regulator, partial [Pseudomonadota bacterium]
ICARSTNRLVKETLQAQFEIARLNGRLRETNESLHAEIAEREKTAAQLKATMDEAKDANLAKSKFLANMSHEIRTPMNGIIGMTDLLARTPLTSRQHHQLSLVQTSADTLLRLLNDILDLSRIEAGRIELECTTFNIREAVGDVADVMAEQAQSKGLELTYKIAHGVPAKIKGDPVRLRQILINLLGNAIKFTETGSIHLTVGLDDATPVRAGQPTTLRFAIIDTGIGIAPDAVPHLFEAFRQADTSVTRRFGGSGLGLSISYHLVSLMGGELSCESTVGKGSEFSFTATFETVTRYTVKFHRLPERLQAGGVLVVDENRYSVEILETYLASWGIPTRTAKTGTDGLDILREAADQCRRFGLVIYNAVTPDLPGLAFVEQLRNSAFLAETPVILMAPIDWAVSSRDLDNLKVRQTLNKPIRQSQLFNALITTEATLPEQGSDAGADSVDSPAKLAKPTTARFDADVLVVEDNAVNQEVVGDYLRGFGCRVAFADNGRIALEMLAEQSFDLVFMDCQMPELDGYEATARVRKREADTGVDRTAIVALTAGAFAGDRTAALGAGMDDYICKPFVVEELERALSTWLPEHAVVSDRGAQNRQPDSSHSTAADTSVGADARPGRLNDRRHTERRQDLSVQPALEAATIANLRANKPDLLRRLIGIYQSCTPPILESIDRAVSEGDLPALKLAAHSLKSSSANIGANQVAELCQVIEVRCQQGNMDRARHGVRSLHREYARVCAELAETANALDAEHRDGGRATA